MINPSEARRAYDSSWDILVTPRVQLLQQGSRNILGSRPKTWSLDSFRSPIGLTPPESTSFPAQRRDEPCQLARQLSPRTLSSRLLHSQLSLTSVECRLPTLKVGSSRTSTVLAGHQPVQRPLLRHWWTHIVSRTVIADWKTSDGPTTTVDDQLNDFPSPNVDTVDIIPDLHNTMIGKESMQRIWVKKESAWTGLVKGWCSANSRISMS